MKGTVEEILHPDEGSDEQKIDKLMQNPQVQEMLQLLAKKDGEGEPPPQSSIEVALEEIRRAHTQEEVREANLWVSKFFADLITYDMPSEAPRINFATFASTKKSRAKGWTNAADGFIIGRSCLAERIALFYIDEILDPQFETDEARMWGIIDSSKRRGMKAGMLHPEFLFLIGEDEDGSPCLEMWMHGDDDV